MAPMIDNLSADQNCTLGVDVWDPQHPGTQAVVTFSFLVNGQNNSSSTNVALGNTPQTVNGPQLPNDNNIRTVTATVTAACGSDSMKMNLKCP